MYLAQAVHSQDIQTPLYINMFQKFIDGKDSSDKQDVNNAILQAADIALDKQDIYSIDYKHYFLITKLLEDYLEGLKSLKKYGITTKTYSEILSILR